MKNSRNFVNQAFVTAFLVIGAVAISGVVFNYSGKLQIKFGADGIQLQLSGQDSIPKGSK